MAASNETTPSLPSPHSISLTSLDSSTPSSSPLNQQSTILDIGDLITAVVHVGPSVAAQNKQQNLTNIVTTPVGRDITSTGGVMTGC